MKATAKDEVRALLEKLPDDASLNDIQYHIYVRHKIERGLEAIHPGKVIPQAEVEKRMARRGSLRHRLDKGRILFK